MESRPNKSHPEKVLGENEMTRKMGRLIFSGTDKTANQDSPATITETVAMINLMKLDFNAFPLIHCRKSRLQDRALDRLHILRNK